MSSISKASSTSGSNIVPVTTPTSYPYLVQPSDSFIVVNTSSARTINLMHPAQAGFKVIIKDGTGMANANAITIQGNGSTIDSASEYVIADTYGSVVLIFNGTEWNIIN